MYNIDEYGVRSGRLLNEEGGVDNVVDLIGGEIEAVSEEEYNIDEYMPETGRRIGEDGKLYNVVDMLQGDFTPVSDDIYDIDSYMPMSGRRIGEDGKLYNEVDLLQNSGGTLIEKSVNANGTYNASDDNADGYSKVVVAVPSTDIANIDMKYINFRLDAGGVAHITPLGENIETQTMADNTNLNLLGANIVAAFGGAVKLIEINDPEGLARTIRANAFADSGQNSQAYKMYTEMLKRATLSALRSNNIRTIEGGAFRYNFYIREVNCFYCNSIGENSFAYATALETVTLTGVTNIPPSAFRGCPNLATVQLGTLTIIGGSAFYDCPKLEDIPDLSDVVELGSTAFYGCAKIKEVDLSSINAISVSSSRNQTFRNCTSLESITFGDTPTMFNANNFLQGCTALKDITFKGAVLGIGTTFMSNTGSDSQGTGLTVTFKENTQAQIEALTNYPFGVPNATFVYEG